MSLLPKEHGAYGQIAFPIVTAFGTAGVSTAGLLCAATVMAGFLAHEPCTVLLGHRGPRARRELRGPAMTWLGSCLAVGVATGFWALVTIDPTARWSVLVPVAAALALMVAIVRGREKSWHGEVAASLAFAGTAVPISMAAGAPTTAAVSVAVPFALLFVASTLAVRVVIVRVRGGGDPRAATATRRAVLAFAAVSTATLVVLTANQVFPASVLASSAPGLLVATVVALRPPAPARLRTLGWTLVAVSLVTAGMVVGMA
jgi:hypothetical protein